MTKPAPTALPDFIIIGAMKCGTSTLAAQLGAQPGIFMTNPKEPNFFSDDAVWARGPGWYQSLFAQAQSGDLLGEASTHYTKLPTYPDTIARLQGMVAAPRLVYLIRNPVDRLVSHFIHEWTMGVMDGAIDEAVQDHPELVEYGCYGAQMAPWVDAFGADAVMIQTTARMRRDPQAVVAEVAAFIGHTGAVSWRDLPPENVSAERIRRRPLDAWLIDSAAATWLRRRLVPQALRDRVKAGRQMRERPVLSPETRAAVEARFAADHAVLTAITGARHDIDACYPFLRGTAA